MPFAPKPPACLGCPAAESGKSFVPPSGPHTARVAFVGQGPGREEAEGHWNVETQDWHRAPFIGRSGHKLNLWLERVNSEPSPAPPLHRHQCFMTNIVQCWLTKNGKDRPPTVAEAAFCRKAHLEPQLQGLPNLQVLVPIGVPAIRGIVEEGANELWAGGTYKLERESLQ